MSDQQEEGDQFAIAMFMQLAAKADPILARKIADLGQPDWKALGRKKVGEILRDSLLEAAAQHLPDADMPALRRGTLFFTSDVYADALGRLLKARGEGHGAFDLAQGVDAAVVLAAWGLPVAPLDRKTMQQIGDVATTPEDAARIFGARKTAYVGYQPAAAGFHLAVTDCTNTMLRQINVNPRLAALKASILRDGQSLPPPTYPAFKHGSLIGLKAPTDQVECYLLDDPSPHSGSVLLTTGWIEEGEHHGVPQEWFGVPKRLITEALYAPQLASIIPRAAEVAKPTTVH